MLLRLAWLILVAVIVSACTDDPASEDSRPTAAAPEPPTAPTPTTARPEQTTPTAPPQLEILAGGVLLTATLRDTAAARDLLAQLPARLTMRDHGGVEKTGPLARALDVSREPDGADPEVGDLGYYTPGNDLVLYYGDQSYYAGIVILGRLQGDLAALADLEGDVDVEVLDLGHDSR